MKRIEAVNDFVIKFANVNGSGSASANELFAKAVMRMGVPVSPRNIFPSNIQGMPTWYEARVCEKGYHGRRGGVDMMVAMNPQTWDADIAEIEIGGYLFYDSTRPMPANKFRDDVHNMGVPLTEIANMAYTDPRQRQLFKNIIYVGALSVLLDVEAEVFEKLFSEQFKGKERLLESNIKALHLGRDYVKQHMQAPLGIRVQRADNVGDQIFTDGNSAAGLGLVYGGATVAAWYPITPSTSIPEAFQKYCEKFRVDPATGQHKFAIVQAEDELASIGMVVGAGWNGARAFTATSGSSNLPSTLGRTSARQLYSSSLSWYSMIWRFSSTTRISCKPCAKSRVMLASSGQTTLTLCSRMPSWPQVASSSPRSASAWRVSLNALPLAMRPKRSFAPAITL